MAFLVIGAGMLVAGRLVFQNNNTLVTQFGSAKNKEATSEAGFIDKIIEAFSFNESMKCSWEKDSESQGFAYIKNQRVYNENTLNGRKIYSIMANNCTYTWEPKKPNEEWTGFRFCLAPDQQSQNAATNEQFPGALPDTKYRCHPVVIPDTTFSPPSQVRFLDVGKDQLLK